MILHMSGAMDKRFIGGGLRLAAGSAAPPRLDHGYFEDEVRPMLGSILLKKGWISNDKLDAALEAARISGMRLGETLLSRGWLFEPELACALAEQVGTRNLAAQLDDAVLHVDVQLPFGDGPITEDLAPDLVGERGIVEV